jgi:hypothetical protein
MSARQVIEIQLNSTSRRPLPRRMPIIEISHDGSEFLNLDRYVTINVPVDTNHFNDSLECQITSRIISTQYNGTLNPLYDGIWMMVHDHPLATQDSLYATILYPGDQSE